VRDRKVQVVDGISSVHRLRHREVRRCYRTICSNIVHSLSRRDVFHSSRGLSKLDMQRLSVKLQLPSG
jgi:hypothetical protein